MKINGGCSGRGEKDACGRGQTCGEGVRAPLRSSEHAQKNTKNGEQHVGCKTWPDHASQHAGRSTTAVSTCSLECRPTTSSRIQGCWQISPNSLSQKQKTGIFGQRRCWTFQSLSRMSRNESASGTATRRSSRLERYISAPQWPDSV